MGKTKGKANVALNIACLAALLMANFTLFRQDFVSTSGLTANYVFLYTVFGVQGAVLLVAFLRTPSRKFKMAALNALIACAIGFAFEVTLLANHVAIFDARLRFS